MLNSPVASFEFVRTLSYVHSTRRTHLESTIGRCHFGTRSVKQRGTHLPKNTDNAAAFSNHKSVFSSFPSWRLQFIISTDTHQKKQLSTHRTVLCQRVFRRSKNVVQSLISLFFKCWLFFHGTVCVRNSKLDALFISNYEQLICSHCD